MTYFCIVFVRAPAPLARLQLHVQPFPRYKVVPKFKIMSPYPSLSEDQHPHLTQCSVGPKRVHFKQPASWSVQPFMKLNRVTDWQTPRSSVTIVCISCVQCSLEREQNALIFTCIIWCTSLTYLLRLLQFLAPIKYFEKAHSFMQTCRLNVNITLHTVRLFN